VNVGKEESRMRARTFFNSWRRSWHVMKGSGKPANRWIVKKKIPLVSRDLTSAARPLTPKGKATVKNSAIKKRDI